MFLIVSNFYQLFHVKDQRKVNKYGKCKCVSDGEKLKTIKIGGQLEDLKVYFYPITIETCIVRTVNILIFVVLVFFCRFKKKLRE